MKKITKAVVSTAFALGSLGALAAPASASHQHSIETPQEQQIVLPCEPAGTAAYDNHPRHWQLHKGPSADNRAITVVVSGSCTEPFPSGPVQS